ncbi:hypothetical protein [Lachnoclostridium sp.]|uniref:hypothetical protein n=1 Tax=Lachnoclostridium sp. TaxID=2028282 RepID=UPI002897321A|nr:hypothetical protein [Lachnoclostridium sp.]
MKNIIVDCYENYKEEDRLTTNNARKIEFITTTRIFDEFEVWCDYQYRICREKSILGASNHVIIAGIK